MQVCFSIQSRCGLANACSMLLYAFIANADAQMHVCFSECSRDIHTKFQVQLHAATAAT